MPSIRRFVVRPRLSVAPLQLAIAAIGVSIALVTAAAPPDPERGRLLYENHCTTCHSSNVHRRSHPVPMDIVELRRIASDWAKEENLGWSESEVGDVVDYLARVHYRLKR